jgi:hypothetical protein
MAVGEDQTMSEPEARRQLRRMLRHFTPGSILHLMSEAYRQKIEEAGLADDPTASVKCDTADRVLFCVGIGLDAVLPR